jgi:hypothetical protein
MGVSLRKKSINHGAFFGLTKTDSTPTYFLRVGNKKAPTKNISISA